MGAAVARPPTAQEVVSATSNWQPQHTRRLISSGATATHQAATRVVAHLVRAPRIGNPRERTRVLLIRECVRGVGVKLGLDGPSWTTCEAFEDGRALYAAVCELGYEGVVAKDRASLYGFGERGWVRSRTRTTGGVMPNAKRWRANTSAELSSS